MKLTQTQIELLTNLTLTATAAGSVSHPTLFTEIGGALSGDLLVLEGEGLVSFVKVDEVDKANAAEVTGAGWSALSLLAVTEDIVVPVPTPEIQELTEKVSPMQAMSTQLRQAAVKALKSLSPADYEEYKALKFKGVAHGQRPSLEQAKKAYVWAFTRFLEITYTESGV